MSKTWLPWLAIILIIFGQFYYLPDRLSFLRQLFAFARTADSLEVAQMAYYPADYELLAWVERQTSPDTTLLLVTSSPHTYGDPSYVLYHRALYHLYPRSLWWAAPVSPTRYPAWWTFTDLSEKDILDIAQKYQATAILADGFARPPVSGPAMAFDADTQLTFLENKETQLGHARWIQSGEDNNGVPLIGGRQSAVPRGGFALIGRLLWLLAALLSLWLWGDLIYSLTIHPYLTPSPAQRIAASWLFGCGLTSLGAFFLLWSGARLTTAVFALSLLGCLLWLFIHRKSRCFARFASPLRLSISTSLHLPVSSFPHLLASSPLRLLFSLILTVQAGLIAFAAWASPLTDWDAWVNWAGKANALFIDQSLSPNLYHNPARLPTNMDYPLLLPLTEAWFYTWLGQMDESSARLISLLFYLALLLLFYHAARLLVPPTTALGFTVLLATIPRLERPAASALADIPLAALVLLSFILLYKWYKNLSHPIHSPLLPPFGVPEEGCSPAPSPSLFSSPLRLPPSWPLLLALALSTGFLPWLKNEGWLWWLLVSLSLFGGLVWLVKRGQLPASQALALTLVYLLPALVIPFGWQSFLALNGTYRFTFLPLTLTTFWTNLPRLPGIGVNLGIRLLNPYWNFIWLFTGLILIGQNKKVGLAPLGWLILPVVGYLGLAGLSYVFSRFEPYLAHLNNSAERLMLQAAPLVLWWLIGQCVSMGWVKSND